MKEEIFKVNYEKYECVTHHDRTPLSYPHPDRTDIFRENIIVPWLDDNPEEKVQIQPKRRKKRLVYVPKEMLDSEESYLENYGNPLAKVLKRYTMVVVEKQEYKVSLKLFWGFRERSVGNVWFKISRNVNYLTINTKTGDVYCGHLYNFQKKRKSTKKINKNFFLSEPINTMKMRLRNILISFTENHYEVSMKAISTFMNEIDNRDEFEQLDFEKRLFRYYLNKKEIKYPNNFHLYAKELFGPKIRKTLKKNGKRLVDAFMIENGMTGKRLKLALHNCTNLNKAVYLNARKLFGDDWINQDSNFILNALNYEHDTFNVPIPAEFLNVISKDELRRVFRLYKKVYFDGALEVNTFFDHIRMYTELKLYGETDLRWESDDNNKDLFRQEHLDWSDKLQFYKRGHYERLYPNYTYDLIERVIGDYYPVILNSSTNYNEESSIQSNCVKTYIGRPSSLIVSLRKGSPSSDERATIEYKLSKEGDKIKCHRVQSLGRFNGKLEEHWMGPLFKLDEMLLSYIKDKRFDTVKITKKCANGSSLESNSEWDDGGMLRWTYRAIESNQTIFDWI
jgi:hypothetical protein